MRWNVFVRLVIGAVLLAIGASACGGDGTTPGGGKTELRLGYFPNLTHAPALIGVEKGFFAEALGSDVTLKTATFNHGTEAATALLAGQLDITYIGPNPAINAYSKDKSSIRIISGAASGGAALVVKPSIGAAADLKGKKLATPSIGNTQDVALRAWLGTQGIEVTREGGDVTIVGQQNSQTLDTFKAGAIDGAWVPEPWATRLELEGGGKVLVDESDLWPEGRFVTTHIIVRKRFLDESPGTVEAFLRGHAKAVAYAASGAAEAKTVVNGMIEKLTGKPLQQATIDQAWDRLEFTVDPIKASLERSADEAEKVGLLDPVDLTGIYSLTILNGVLVELGETPIAV